MELQTMPLRFRVWDSCTDEWVRPYGRADWPSDEPYIYPLGNMLQRLGKTINWLDGKRFIISQDTGIRDKEGIRIYTGDLVKCDDVIGCVEYYNGYLGLRTGPHESAMTTWIGRGEINEERVIEVVGNIWQNPELLEKKIK